MLTTLTVFLVWAVPVDVEELTVGVPDRDDHLGPIDWRQDPGYLYLTSSGP